MQSPKKAILGLVFLIPLGASYSYPALAQDRVANRNEIIVNNRVMPSLQAAFDRVPANGYVFLGPGTFRMSGILKTDGVTVIGTRDTWLDGVAADGKAAITVKAKTATIDGVNCRNIRVPSQNGSCIRHEGGRLLVRNVTFKDSEQGILTWKKSEDLTVEDSLFENLGKIGRAHAIYVAGQSFTLRRCKILKSVNGGHEIKTRAARSVIQRNLIASVDGDDSRLIDAPNGGRVIITDNLFVEGVNSENRQMIAFSLFPNETPGTRADMTLMRNVIVSDRPGTRLFLFGEEPYTLTMTQNVLIGSLIFSEDSDIWPDNNYYYETREDWGLPPAPQLPEVTLR